MMLCDFQISTYVVGSHVDEFEVDPVQGGARFSFIDLDDQLIVLLLAMPLLSVDDRVIVVQF